MSRAQVDLLPRLLVVPLALACTAASAPAGDDPAVLAGLWASHRRFGPQLEGTLLLRDAHGRPIAEIGGLRSPVTVDGPSLSFGMPDGAKFEGVRLSSREILGHWIQPPSRFDGNVFATPVELRRRPDGWRGEVHPQPDTGTFYLRLEPREDGLSASLFNPERNLGAFAELTRAQLEAGSVSLHGSFRGRGPESVMLRGSYHEQEDLLSILHAGRGGLYEFRRTDPEAAAGFLARHRTDGPLLDAPPPELGDGWRTASPREVGIDPEPIRRMIETYVLPRPTSPHDLSIHAVLVARNGRLAVEEYFHGYHRGLPHDSRSASKSVTSILAAAAMRSGVPLSWESGVYRVMASPLLAGDPRRDGITLRHLVNMTSGLDCDDRSPESAANEDYLWDHAEELDFYEHTLSTKVLHPPGEVAAYCSASANLAGGVIEAAAGRSLLQLIHRLVADPLDIERYSVPLPPDGHPFMGGGIRWLPRDFLKFPQLLLDGGTWNGRRILSREDARRLITPEVKIDGGRDYGYLWWTIEYPYRDRSVKAHFMGGNGGQIAMLVPDLGLTLAFMAGNYSDPVMFRIQNEIVPKLVLPAVRD